MLTTALLGSADKKAQELVRIRFKADGRIAGPFSRELAMGAVRRGEAEIIELTEDEKQNKLAAERQAAKQRALQFVAETIESLYASGDSASVVVCVQRGTITDCVVSGRR